MALAYRGAQGESKEVYFVPVIPICFLGQQASWEDLCISQLESADSCKKLLLREQERWGLLFFFFLQNFSFSNFPES